jgi:PelA/Pel-15E family pectate lyase
LIGNPKGCFMGISNFRLACASFAVFSVLLISACSTATFPTQDSLLQSVPTSPAERDWDAYRKVSEHIHKMDQAFIVAELEQVGLDEPFAPPQANRFGFDPDQPVAYYGTAEGRRIADNLLSFQTPSGGWSKRTDMAAHPRQPGEAFGVEQDYIPTFDNNATTTQLWVLTKAYEATGDTRYSDAVLRTIKLILLAQYPNGGWPQNFPLTGGYHDDITFNDAVMSNLVEVMYAASIGGKGMDFVPQALRRSAGESYQRALQNILDTQVITDGQRTLWGAQHDPVTLLPSAARTFEPVALATSESAELLLFLMQIDKPSAAMKNAIAAAVGWFQAHQIFGYVWLPFLEGGSRLHAKEGAGPLWPRFAELDTNRPVFGDRDGGVYYDVNEISRERHAGYAWYTEAPAKVLRAYPQWRARHF